MLHYPTTISVMILLTLLTVSCSYAAENEVQCEVVSQWRVNNIDMSESEDYVDVDVYEAHVEILGAKFGSDKRIIDQLNKVKAHYNSGVLPPIFLRSDKSVDCLRFQRIARLIASEYPCEGKRLCIWAYGLGLNAMPLGIPPPPAENE